MKLTIKAGDIVKVINDGYLKGRVGKVTFATYSGGRDGTGWVTVPLENGDTCYYLHDELEIVDQIELDLYMQQQNEQKQSEDDKALDKITSTLERVHADLLGIINAKVDKFIKERDLLEPLAFPAEIAKLNNAQADLFKAFMVLDSMESTI